MLLYFYLLSLRYRFGEMRDEIKARRLAARRLMGRLGICLRWRMELSGGDLAVLVSLKRRYRSAQKRSWTRLQLGGGDG